MEISDVNDQWCEWSKYVACSYHNIIFEGKTLVYVVKYNRSCVEQEFLY